MFLELIAVRSSIITLNSSDHPSQFDNIYQLLLHNFSNSNFQLNYDNFFDEPIYILLD